jgi:hypothetical protein
LSNPYYPHVSELPAAQTRALATQVAAEFDLIAAGFDLVPTPAQLWGGSANYAVDTGVANAMVIAISANVIALTSGLTFNVLAIAANTGAATLAPGALGVTPVVRADGSVLQAGDILAGQIIQVAYSVPMSSFQLVNSGAAVSATAAAASAASAALYAASATNAANVYGTSTSSVAIPGTVAGTVSFTYVEAARTIAVGMYILAADTAAPGTNTITLQVTAWNSTTKVVTGNVVALQGTGTKTAWTLSLTGSPGGGPGDVQVFSASGTWSKPTNAKFVMVELWGAGSGGQASVSTNAATFGVGGNGGGYTMRVFRATDLATSVVVTIGAGGIGGTTDAGTGAAGGNTTFGSLATAQGGQVAAGGGISVGTAGIGEAGATASAGLADRGGARASTSASGAGGSSVLGGAAGGAGGTSGGAGGAGGIAAFQTTPTAGGGGAAGTGGATATNGTAGTAAGTTWPVGTGGGGGGAATAGAGGTGGAGGVACGGGGGGGASAARGNGGSGGNGYARITSW